MAQSLITLPRPDIVGDRVLTRPSTRQADAPATLGFGTAPLAGVAVGDAVAAIETAVRLGISFYDTAPRYGAGEAERLLGFALRGIDRSRYRISTKVGWLIPEDRPSTPILRAEPVPAFSRDAVHRSLEGSLSRLGLDRVDLAFIHDPEDHIEVALSESAPALMELRDLGLVGSIGVGTTDVEAAIQLVTRCELDYCLIAGRYSLLNQEAVAELIPLCEARGVSTIIGGVFNSGILAAPGLDGPFDYRAAPHAIRIKAAEIASIAARHEAPLAAVALQYPARDRAVDCVLTGMKSAEEVEANVGLFGAELSKGLWNDLARSGLVREPCDQPDPRQTGDDPC